MGSLLEEREESQVDRAGLDQGVNQGVNQGTNQGMHQGVNTGVDMGVDMGVDQGVSLAAGALLALRRTAVARQCQKQRDSMTRGGADGAGGLLMRFRSREAVTMSKDPACVTRLKDWLDGTREGNAYSANDNVEEKFDEVQREVLVRGKQRKDHTEWSNGPFANAVVFGNYGS